MQDEGGDTLLIKACRCGHVETARVLLDHGANVDQQNNVSRRTW
jgi:ankyrin repeat protein